MKTVMGLAGKENDWDLHRCSMAYLSLVRRYDILNLQGNVDQSENQLHYVQVGTWNTGKLSLNTSAIRFFSDQRSLENITVRRFCSESCQIGHVKVSLHAHHSIKMIACHSSFRNTPMMKDVVGNVTRVEMRLYWTK